MIKILQILIVIFTVANVCPAFAGAAADKINDAQIERNTVRLTVKDGKGKPIPGLVIKTLNIQPQYQTTTDSNGIARFKNKCSAYADLGYAYSKENRTNKQTKKRPVRIEISDPDKKYKTSTTWLEWDDLRNMTGCDRTATLNDNLIRETFPSPKMLKLAFDSRTGKLKFYDICTSGQKPGGAIQSGCITVFKDVQVQINEAIFLAKEYMFKNIIPENDPQNLGIECAPLPVRTKSHQDFLKCTSMGGKYAYDFEFDDLIESSDSTIMTNAADALCSILNGGTFETFSGYRMCKKQSAKETETMCNDLRGLTHDLSWTTEFHQDLTVGYMAQSTAGGATYQDKSQPIQKHDVCLFDFRKADRNYEPRNIANNGLDIRKYEYITIRSLPSLEFLMRQFTEAQMHNMGYVIEEFRCAQGFRQWNSPNGNKHLLECHITYKTASGKQSFTDTVDFVFNDVNVRMKLKSNASEGGMGCIAQGGSFDGSKCRGLTKEECDTLGTKIPGGTKWDQSINQCTLKDASAFEALETAKDITLTSVAIAGGVAAIALTGGTGAPAVLVAMSQIGGGMIIAGTVAEKGSKDIMTGQMESFKNKYDFCKNQKKEEQDACARSVLQSFLGYVQTYLGSGVFEGQYAKSLNEIFVNLIDMTEPNKITQGEIKYYSIQKLDATALSVIHTGGKVVGAIGDFLAIFGGGAIAIKSLATKGISLGANGVGNAANTTKTAKFFTRLWNLSKKSYDSATNTYTIVADKSKITQMLEVPALTVGMCWVNGELNKCTNSK